MTNKCHVSNITWFCQVVQTSPYIYVKDGLPVGTLIVKDPFEAILVTARKAATFATVAIAQIVVAPLILLLNAGDVTVAPLPVTISQQPRQ